MEKNEIAKVLDEIRSNPDVMKELREQKTAETPEEIAAVWAKAAAGLGHSVSAEEISAYILEAEGEMKRKAQAAKDGIENLSEQELAEVAGGKGHSDCRDTFKDRENCWYSDGCDHIYQDYKHYVCKRSDYDPKCGKTHACDYTATCGADW